MGQIDRGCVVIDSLLHSRLTSNAGVSALVGSRVYSTWRPQDDGTPCVTFMRVSSQTVYLLSTTSGTTRYLYQIDCWGSTVDEALRLSDAVTAAMETWTTNSGDPLIDYAFNETGGDASVTPFADGESMYPRVRLDFVIWARSNS